MMVEQDCPSCHGHRLRPESLNVKIGGRHIGEVAALTLDEFHMANIGIDNMDVLNSNLEILKNYSPLGEEKMDEVRMALQPFYEGKNLAWMHRDYQDRAFQTHWT